MFRPLWQILRSPDDDGGGTPAAEPEKPANITQDEWDDATPEERIGLSSTDEGEGANQTIDGSEYEEEAALSDTDIDAVIAEAAEAEGKTPEQLLAEDEAAALAAVEAAKGAGEKPADETPAPAAAPTEEHIPTDEDLLSFRPVVQDSEIPLPKINFTPPKELTDKLDALDTREDEVNAWFAEGQKPDGADFTKADLTKAMREITNQRDDIKQDIAEQKMEARVQQRDIEKENLTWLREQEAFNLANKDLYRQFVTGEDGKPVLDANGKPQLTEKSKLLYAAFATKVNALLNDPANKGKSGMQVQLEADRVLRKELGLPPRGKQTAAPAAKPEEKKPDVKPAAQRRTAPSLKDVPISGNEDVSNPFAAILALTGEPYERAIERLNPGQMERFYAFADRQR